MSIKKIVIHNFKCFRDFNLELNPGLNILVGDNEAGKSTILEAIHLALTGTYAGRSIRNSLTAYLFNADAVKEYVGSLKGISPMAPPSLSIEVFFDGSLDPLFEGNLNSDKANCVEGFIFEIAFSEQYKAEYEQMLQNQNIVSLPIEYYGVFWKSFSRDSSITTRSIPIKSVMIDSSNYRYQNGSDAYISRIVKELLEPEDIVSITQAYRKLIDNFAEEKSIEIINNRISEKSTIFNEDISLTADKGTQKAWEESLITQVAGIPFSYIGKGAQCAIKTELALSHRNTDKAAVILLEEPESHLSYSKLNQLISSLIQQHVTKQIIVSTHSSFVANKLGLDNLILVNREFVVKLTALDSASFFKKIAGYDTLRLILCKKAILVEGDSDELVVQRAYMDAHSGKLPIEDGIDVISVGLTFLRFLEVATALNKPVAVVSDNDGNYDAVKNKYAEYLGENKKVNIDICIDSTVDKGDLEIGGKPYNYNTLEPKLLKENSLETFNRIFGTAYDTEDELRKYMKDNKTKCALDIFDAKEQIKYPKYIMEAIENE